MLRIFKNIRLGSLFKVPIDLNVSTIILVILIGVFFGFYQALILSCLFVIVVIHEFGHILVARKLGYGCDKILLIPLGGLAFIRNVPSGNRDELLIALAGPMTNVVMAILGSLLTVAVVFLDVQIGYDLALFIRGLLLFTLLNAAVFAFNMIPAFPMDGGRVLRALLTMKSKNIVQATRVATYAAYVIAGIFGIISIMIFHPMLLFVAIFIAFGSYTESKRIYNES